MPCRDNNLSEDTLSIFDCAILLDAYLRVRAGTRLRTKAIDEVMGVINRKYALLKSLMKKTVC